MVPMSAVGPHDPGATELPPLPQATLPLWDVVPARARHYFHHAPDRGAYTTRRYEFGSSLELLPLVRAFLNTCAAHRDADYRYLFTLLGSELVNNALTHSRSGHPHGRYALTCRRRGNGLHLTCADQGDASGRTTPAGETHHLVPDPHGLDPGAERGRGLAMLDALATGWGDSGIAELRQVWFFLAYDLTDSRWTQAP
ncbi:ATP-binding protein [Nocardiopsis lambiniae]|uniref:ATP-binding protein n=1 Tax=Nocardiopsis lambiniae TaxID=3075539 RepID=A0ABU2MFH9_9ACTN|nr:ATP-binding protein [Nocardiopsis sp. DSM 44743]MDT0331457.1 ATP-binding protein [Nocardiopsis sp. DSM 44743]